jgi:hypothetical protein
MQVLSQLRESGEVENRRNVAMLQAETLGLLLLELIQQTNDANNAFSPLNLRNLTLSLRSHFETILSFFKVSASSETL